MRARYDKIHMFDVDLDGGESYRESAAYRPGEAAVLAEAAGLRLGHDDLLRPAVSASLPRPRRGPGRRCWRCLRPSRCRPGGRTGTCCCGRGRSRPGPTCWRRRSRGCMRRSEGRGADDLRPQPRGRAVGRGAARPRRGGGGRLRRDRPGRGGAGAGAGAGARARPAVCGAGVGADSRRVGGVERSGIAAVHGATLDAHFMHGACTKHRRARGRPVRTQSPSGGGSPGS